MNRQGLALASCIAALRVAAPVQAQTILLSADLTSVLALTDESPLPIAAGNQSFYSRFVRPGDTVGTFGFSYSQESGFEARLFYNRQPGVSARELPGAITAEELSSLDVMISAAPFRAFADTEALALREFVEGGGTLMLFGEASGIAFAGLYNGYLNSLLDRMGSNLRLSANTLDAGINTATGAQIVASPWTSGVTEFVYGGVGEVVGGSALFKTMGGSTFMAIESSVSPVPEPGSWWLWAAGLVGLGALRRVR